VRIVKGLRAVVTGGAGFIGSYLTEELLNRKYKVTVVDDFSAGAMKNIQPLVKNSSLKVVREDLKKPEKLDDIVAEHDLIFHLAANPEVRVGQTEPKVHFQENVLVTFNLLEAVRRAGGEKSLVFTSTSTVYGDACEIPTPEDYGPLIPISTYGASKLASEALIMSYVHTFGLKGLILRLANVVGARSNHGVIFDFMKKISVNREELEVLGDGMQEKSYLYVTDLVEAVMYLTEHGFEEKGKTAIYNVGSKDRVTVKDIAEVVAQEMGVPGIRFRFTGGVDGGRGWKGDVKNMQLSIRKLLDSGWKPKYSSRQAVKRAARELMRELRKEPARSGRQESS
jgi:UDP-glucose 4-epimerase